MAKCIKCGKEGEFRLFCPQCYVKNHPIAKPAKRQELIVCPSCSKLFHKNKWKDAKDLEDAASSSLIERIDVNPGYEVKDIEIATDLSEIKPANGKVLDTDILIQLTAGSSEIKADIKDELTMPIHLHFKPCPKCSLKGTQYFEATLQIRNVKEELLPKIEEFAKKDQEAGSHINKVEKVRGGVDFLMTSQHHIKKLGVDLQRKFGGELSMSPRLQSKDSLTSKDLYRVSVLLKLPDVGPNDYISHEGRVLKVQKAGKEVIGRDIIDNTNVKIDVTRTRPKPLEIHKTVITKVKPQIEAMNPVSFQSEKLENARKQKLGQKIRIVVADDKIFIVD